MNTFLQFARAYLKTKLKGSALLVAFGVVFIVVIRLHKIDTNAVLYAIEICLYIGIAYTLADFLVQYFRYRALKRSASQVLVSLESLSIPKTIFEQEYHRLLECLSVDRKKVMYTSEEQKKEMIDYYTLWAHQIKVPITGMKLHLQRNKSKENTSLLLELFQIEQYVEMVLSYLRVKQMSSDMVLKEYNLDSIVKQAVRKYGKVFVNKKIRLDLKPCECTVLTDEKWLSFVIEQLLSNALKYTNSGQISIYLDPVSAKTLIIEDTGIGISDADLPRVFEKGFTGYNGRYDKSASGIGLYLCKTILTNLSHTISIESAVNKGTIVKISLETLSLKAE